MTVLGENILRWLGPLKRIKSVLELGNKRNGTGAYKDYFEARGIRHVSVDLNGRDGALPLDLRKPLNLGIFDMVTNFGTSEHVSEQEPCWRNIAEAAGKVIVSATPQPGCWRDHGMFYPAIEFYREFAAHNGFRIDLLEIAKHGSPRALIVVRLLRRRRRRFVMPTAPIFRNMDRDRYDWPIC